MTILKRAQKVCKYLGYFCILNLSPITFKNCPIQSHCCYQWYMHSKQSLQPLLSIKAGLKPNATQSNFTTKTFEMMHMQVGIVLAFLCSGILMHYPVQRTLEILGLITVWLASSLTSLDPTASLHTINHIFSVLVISNHFKLETTRTVILPLTVLCLVAASLLANSGLW